MERAFMKQLTFCCHGTDTTCICFDSYLWQEASLACIQSFDKINISWSTFHKNMTEQVGLQEVNCPPSPFVLFVIRTKYVTSSIVVS